MAIQRKKPRSRGRGCRSTRIKTCGYYTPPGGGCQVFTEAELAELARFDAEIDATAEGEADREFQKAPDRQLEDYAIAALFG